MEVLNLDTFTIVACCVIAAAFVFAWIYIAFTNSTQFANRKKWIDQLPSVVSTLGVLGTFLGITKGLMSFDTTDLDKSIPLLLEGLKTAFFTSLLGMSGSLILNRVVSHKFDKEAKESEAEKAAKLIVDTLKSNQNNLPAILNNSNKDLVKVLSEDATIKIIRADVEQLKDDIEEIKGHIEEIREVMGGLGEQNSRVINLLDTINASAGNTAEEIPRLRAVAVTATASISAIDNNVEEINVTLTNLENEVSEINENVETIKSKDEENF